MRQPTSQVETQKRKKARSWLNFQREKCELFPVSSRQTEAKISSLLFGEEAKTLMALGQGNTLGRWLVEAKSASHEVIAKLLQSPRGHWSCQAHRRLFTRVLHAESVIVTTLKRNHCERSHRQARRWDFLWPLKVGRSVDNRVSSERNRLYTKNVWAINQKIGMLHKPLLPGSIFIYFFPQKFQF